MNYQLSYKIGTVIFSVAAFISLFVFFSQHGNIFQPKTAPQSDIALADELRMHRQVLVDIRDSSDPQVPQSVRTECDKGVKEINDTLYSAKPITPEQELKIRIHLQQISKAIHVEYADKVMPTEGQE